MRAKLLRLIKKRWWLFFVWLGIHSWVEKPIKVGECLIFLGLIYLDRKFIYYSFVNWFHAPVREMRRVVWEVRHPREEGVNWKEEGF